MSPRPEGGRLREILEILARHQIARGLTPEKLRAILEELGPTFVKLGQILSMRRDMLPEEYCRELGKLRADVAPMPFSQVKTLLEAEYRRGLEEVFSSFSPTPLGSASIAQVHAAVLPDGRHVAVKLRRPGVAETMERDIALLRRAAGPISLTDLGGVLDWNQLLDELWSAAQQELDFLAEAKNAEEFRAKNQSVRSFSCPEVLRAYTSERVLVMEYIDGIPIDQGDRLEAAGYDREDIGRKLAGQYVKQVVDDGFFHADPHPGNLVVRGGTIAWLDLGMMGRLSRRDQRALREGVRTFAEGDVDGFRAAVLSIAVCRGPVDEEALSADLRQMMDRYGSAALGTLDLGEALKDFFALAKKHHIALPDGIALLGRGILTLEGTLAALSPELDLLEILKDHVKAQALASFDWKAGLEEQAWRLLTAGPKAAGLPGQAAEVLRTVQKGQARVTVQLAGQEREGQRRERWVNRLIRCLLCCALLLGGCLLCTAGLSPAPLGIPVPAWVCFALAAVLGGQLLWTMWPKK